MKCAVILGHGNLTIQRDTVNNYEKKKKKQKIIMLHNCWSNSNRSYALIGDNQGKYATIR